MIHTPPRPRRRTVAAVLAGAFAGAIALGGCGKPQAPAARGPASPPEVGVLTVQPERVVLTTELVGRTVPRLVAEVRPQVSGIVTERRFTEGADVRAGEVLYLVDPETYRAAHEAAQANLARAKAALARAEAAASAARTGLAGARAARARAEANVPPRRARAERLGELVAIDAVSRQDHDDAAAALRQAEADLEAATAAVDGAEAGIAGADAAVLAARADITAAEAALEAARINLARTEVTAPIAGRIGRSAVTTGALVTASQPAALATIQQLDPIFVDVAESAAHLLRLRQRLAEGKLRRDAEGRAAVRLVLENGAPYAHEGRIAFADVTVSSGTGSVTLRSVFPNPEHLLLPGMFVRALVEEGVEEQAILVPQRGVSRTPKGEAVALVVGEGDKVEARTLSVDRAIGDRWLVTGGLAAGDRVILEGLQRARPGSPVTAVPFGAPPATAPSPAGTAPAAK